jgi:hypothetical protein
MLVLLLAGCTVPAAKPDTAPLDQGSPPVNLFLLDAPRPFGTTVSDGAEPMMLVMTDGTLFIGDWTGLYRSTDNGATWAQTPDPFLEIGNVLADGWALAEDAQGTLYAADTSGPNVGVAASHNNGQTWEPFGKVVAVGSIVDRPWIAARGNGEVALVVNSDRGEECYRSTDGGQTWTSFSIANDGAPNAGNLKFDSVGRLWYSNGAQIWRWSAPCLNAPLPIALPASGPQIFTQVDLDAQDRIYWADPSPDSSSMRLWGRAPQGVMKMVTVSAPALQSNSFGALSVDQVTGEVAVAWYGSETPGDPSATGFGGAWNVYVTRVSDFWGSTPTTRTDRLTTEANHVGDFCMGGIGCTTGAGDRDLLDYFGIDYAGDHSLHVAYGHDGSGSSEEVRYARLGP